MGKAIVIPASPGVEASIRIGVRDFRDMLALVSREYGFEPFVPVGQLVRFRETRRGKPTGRWFIVETKAGLKGGPTIRMGWPPVCCTSDCEPAPLPAG